MNELKACPFCGSTEGFIERYDYSSCYWHCDGCLARGPLRVIENEGEEVPGYEPALAAWNARAEEDAQAVVVLDGWKLVPIYPTDQMLEAATRVDANVFAPLCMLCVIWSEMIADAPQSGVSHG